MKSSIAGSARAGRYLLPTDNNVANNAALAHDGKSDLTGRFPFTDYLRPAPEFLYFAAVFNKLLQLATLIHFNHNITPADQLAVHPQL